MPTRRRKLDQQLTAMILVRVAFLVLTISPYALYRIYAVSAVIDKNDVIHKAVIQLVSAITVSMLYLNYSVC